MPHTSKSLPFALTAMEDNVTPLIPGFRPELEVGSRPN